MMSLLKQYFFTLLLASSLMTITSAYGSNGATTSTSTGGDSTSAFASASSNSVGPFRFTQEQINGQLSQLQTGDMVLINNRRFLAVRGDGQTNTMILMEVTDDSYLLDAKVRDSVSLNLNAKSDGHSTKSANRDFSNGRQSIVGDAPTVSSYSTPTRQSVIVEAAASSSSPGFGAAFNNAASPSYSSTRSQQTSVAARDQHSYSSVSANNRLTNPSTKTEDGVWDYSESILGVADRDYPILAEVPATSFSCLGRHEGGYYADVATRCQVYHICALARKFSFLCPNGTVFNQKTFVCEWWFNVDCQSSPDFYGLNIQIGVTTPRTVSASTGASFSPSQLVQQAVVAENPKPTYGLPSIQQSSVNIVPQQQAVVSQPFEVKPLAQPVTIEQTIRPTYGAPKPQRPSIQPVVIQQSNFNRPSFGLNPPPTIQASVAASAY